MAILQISHRYVSLHSSCLNPRCDKFIIVYIHKVTHFGEELGDISSLLLSNRSIIRSLKKINSFTSYFAFSLKLV